ncbi:MAG: hypothetical protein ACQEXG_04075 [Pseudomonadota bacterium]
MKERKSRSVITRVFVPAHVRDLPNGERVTVPGHYKAPPRR